MAKKDFDEDKYNEQVNGDPDGNMDDEELGIYDDGDDHDKMPED